MGGARGVFLPQGLRQLALEPKGNSLCSKFVTGFLLNFFFSPEVPKGSRVVPCSSPPLVKPQRNLRVEIYHRRAVELALGLTSKPNARFPRDGPETLSTPFQRCLSAPPRLPTKSEQRICLRRGKKSATSPVDKIHGRAPIRRAKMASC